MAESGHTHIWEGIYSSFNEVNSSQNPHNDNIWTRMLVDSLSAAITSLLNNQPIPGINSDEKSLLPFLVSFVSNQKKEPVTILDFGGGLGVDFLFAVKCLGNGIIGKYIIVETENVCRLGETLYEHEAHMAFCTEIPISKVDIVYLDSSLQYVENWRNLICKLASCLPEYFLFVRTPVGRIPTYVSAQINIPSNIIPYRFLNDIEFTDVMAVSGFDLIFSCNSNRSYDQSNFPPEFRLGTTRTMLFKRIAKNNILRDYRVEI